MLALSWFLIFGVVFSRWSGRLIARARCGCQSRHWTLAGRMHPREWILLLIAILQTGATICYTILWYGDLSGDVGIAVFTIIGVMDWTAWWVHSKNSRKKLRDKVLGVVRATAAGLKIVPIPQGVRA